MKKKKSGGIANELLEDLIGDTEASSTQKPDDDVIDLSNEDVEIDFGLFRGKTDIVNNQELPPPPPSPTQDDDHTDFVAGKQKEDVKPPKSPESSTVKEEPTVFVAENDDATTVLESVPEENFPQTENYPSLVGGKSSSLTDSRLSGSENLKIAQQKILELEHENERLRTENEELASAAETFRNKADDLVFRTEDAEGKYSNLLESVKAEKDILLASLSEKDQDMARLRQEISELESRLQGGVKKIKVRERELENRLELVKMEGKALLQSKDDMILNLKRQIDQLGMELDNARRKAQETNKTVSKKQEVLRRTVKTLRLALSLLETEDIQEAETLKKVD